MAIGKQYTVRWWRPIHKENRKTISLYLPFILFFFFIRRAKFKYSVDNLIEVLNNKNAFLIHSERCYIVHYTYELMLWKRHTSTLGDETASRNGMGRIGMGQFFFLVYIYIVAAGSGQRGRGCGGTRPQGFIDVLGAPASN